MAMKQGNSFKGIWRELRLITRRARQVWRLVPRRHKGAFGGAVLLMGFTSACHTAIPLFLGGLVDAVKQGIQRSLTQAALYQWAALFLGLIAATYLIREALQVGRRYLVESSCTRMERVMTIKVVGRLLKADLTTLSNEKVGALNGRISRSVVGFTRFLRLAFLDFFPAVATGAIALVAALAKQPWLGLVMAGIIPVSFFLTVRQLVSQKGVRLTLIRSREAIDGTIVEQLSGIDYVRAANTQQQEIERVALVAEQRRGKELRHHFQMSLFGCAKALTEGLFHIGVLSFAMYLAIRGDISLGDILTFSMLFLSVMHR
jgi:ATP-binding cassette subfamily B protein